VKLNADSEFRIQISKMFLQYHQYCYRINCNYRFTFRFANKKAKITINNVDTKVLKNIFNNKYPTSFIQNTCKKIINTMMDKNYG
jgi:hypothetical protein